MPFKSNAQRRGFFGKRGSGNRAMNLKIIKDNPNSNSKSGDTIRIKIIGSGGSFIRTLKKEDVAGVKRSARTIAKQQGGSPPKFEILKKVKKRKKLEFFG